MVGNGAACRQRFLHAVISGMVRGGIGRGFDNHDAAAGMDIKELTVFADSTVWSAGRFQEPPLVAVSMGMR